MRSGQPIRKTELRRTPIKRKPSVGSKRRTTPTTRAEMKTIIDRLFGRIIRARGECEAKGWRRTPSTDDPELVGRADPARCVGSLQCAHVISRGYFGVRWDERNAVCLCAGCHVYFTAHPLEWQCWVEEYVGLRVYLTLRSIALAYPKFDYGETYAHLAARALAIGLSLK